MTVKHQQLAPTVGPVSDDPPINAMGIFKFLIAMPEEGTPFIFRSWVCVADAQGGFHSYIFNSEEPEIVQPRAIDNTTGLADHLSKIQLSDQIKESSRNDLEKIQSKNFFNVEKVSEITLGIDPTNTGKALTHYEILDNKPISIIGYHLDLTITSTHKVNLCIGRA